MNYQTSVRRLHLFTLLLVGLFSATLLAQSDAELVKLRQSFIDGQNALSRGRLEEAKTIHQQLSRADYVLAPYLEMSLLIAQANKSDDRTNLEFMQKYSGTWLAEKLRLNWLNTLRSKHDYQGYVDNFVVGTGNDIQKCFYLEALLRTGRTEEAYDGAKEMWLVGRSQPDQCDYAFDRWRKSSDFSEEYIWQRYILARRAGETRFSDFLAGQIRNDAIKLRVRAYQSIRSNPEILENVDSFIQGGVGYSAVIAQGLLNFSSKNLDQTLVLWPKYRDAQIVRPDDVTYLLDGLVEELIKHKSSDQLYHFAFENRSFLSEQQYDKSTLKSLLSLDWHRVLDWIDLMPNQQQDSPKWTYWRARALNQIGLSAATYYDKLGTTRDYYSFLASLINDKPFTLAELAAKPSSEIPVLPHYVKAWERAAELERVEYFNNSRLEWDYVLGQLDIDEKLAASNWAALQDLPYLSIQATIKAQAWDYLELRFPISYLTAFKTAANESGMPLTWLYALSRQESAFAREITSPAGAKGLMQLMPNTARESARRLGLRYEADMLSDPQYNLRLGANFLKQAYQQLGQNPIYASAAYNAGVSRVKSWLTGGRDKLPLDVWIESIPFNETRNYVQNVLAFSVIYSAKLGEISPLEQLGSTVFLAR